MKLKNLFGGYPSRNVPNLEEGQTFYLHGLGCVVKGERYNCFNCPFPDCYCTEKEMDLKNVVFTG